LRPPHSACATSLHVVSPLQQLAEMRPKSGLKVNFDLPPDHEGCNNTLKVKLRSEQGAAFGGSSHEAHFALHCGRLCVLSRRSIEHRQCG
jgi:hypothetical protein